MSPTARLAALGWTFREPHRAGGLCSASRRDGSGTIALYGATPDALVALVEDYERSRALRRALK